MGRAGPAGHGWWGPRGSDGWVPLGARPRVRVRLGGLHGDAARRGAAVSSAHARHRMLMLILMLMKTSPMAATAPYGPAIDGCRVAPRAMAMPRSPADPRAAPPGPYTPQERPLSLGIGQTFAKVFTKVAGCDRKAESRRKLRVIEPQATVLYGRAKCCVSRLKNEARSCAAA